MAIRLNANDPASLTVLQGIEALYAKRAQRLSITLPVFNGANLSGAQLLDQLFRHLRNVVRTMKLNGDDVGCDPHCDERPNSCPPCEDWVLSEYQDYWVSLRIVEAVDLAFLREIEAQYLARVPYERGRNTAFQLPAFVPPPAPPPLLGPGKLHELLAFHRYLQTLPSHFSDKFGCDPLCNDDPNSCPPCEDWERANYERYLARLQEWVSKP